MMIIFSHFSNISNIITLSNEIRVDFHNNQKYIQIIEMKANIWSQYKVVKNDLIKYFNENSEQKWALKLFQMKLK